MSNDKYRWCPKGDIRCEYCKHLGTNKGIACSYYKEKGLDDQPCGQYFKVKDLSENDREVWIIHFFRKWNTSHWARS